MNRWAWAEVDSMAISDNVRHLVEAASPSAVWAVVKADGYGHGAIVAARAALSGGAQGLCVALVQEGLELRSAGVTCPILVLSQQPADQLPAAVAASLHLTVYTPAGLAAIEATGITAHPVHLKVDTGMHRVGVRPDDAVSMAAQIDASSATVLYGLSTHLAVADDIDNPFNAEQLALFDTVLAQLAEHHFRPTVVHAANSAAMLAHPAARRDLVRPGIAMYGLLPGQGVGQFCGPLRPALSLHARVAHVQHVAAGQRISYGLRHRFEVDTIVATLPLGYADGVPRRLGLVGGEVLIGGQRRPMCGVVTMDQLMVDCGPPCAGEGVQVGDHAVLIGSQGGETITADDWAALTGTIGYEIVCGISRRIERVDHYPADISPAPVVT